MRRNSSVNKRSSSSSTMVAVSVAAMVAAMLLLPGADAEAVTCGPDKSSLTECNKEVKKGDTFALDCTDTKTDLLPANLVNATAASIQICKGLRAKVADTCTGVALDSIAGVKIKSNDANKWTVDYDGVTGNDDVILNGSCTINSAAKGVWFNFTLKATTTTKAPNNSGATSAFGLATASSVALLGLVFAAA